MWNEITSLSPYVYIKLLTGQAGSDLESQKGENSFENSNVAHVSRMIVTFGQEFINLSANNFRQFQAHFLTGAAMRTVGSIAVATC